MAPPPHLRPANIDRQFDKLFVNTKIRPYKGYTDYNIAALRIETLRGDMARNEGLIANHSPLARDILELPQNLTNANINILGDDSRLDAGRLAVFIRNVFDGNDAMLKHELRKIFEQLSPEEARIIQDIATQPFHETIVQLQQRISDLETFEKQVQQAQGHLVQLEQFRALLIEARHTVDHATSNVSLMEEKLAILQDVNEKNRDASDQRHQTRVKQLNDQIELLTTINSTRTELDDARRQITQTQSQLQSTQAYLSKAQALNDVYSSSRSAATSDRNDIYQKLMDRVQEENRKLMAQSGVTSDLRANLEIAENSLSTAKDEIAVLKTANEKLAAKLEALNSVHLSSKQ